MGTRGQDEVEQRDWSNHQKDTSHPNKYTSRKSGHTAQLKRCLIIHLESKGSIRYGLHPQREGGPQRPMFLFLSKKCNKKRRENLTWLRLLRANAWQGQRLAVWSFFFKLTTLLLVTKVWKYFPFFFPFSDTWQTQSSCLTDIKREGSSRAGLTWEEGAPSNCGREEKKASALKSF